MSSEENKKRGLWAIVIAVLLALMIFMKNVILKLFGMD